MTGAHANGSPGTTCTDRLQSIWKIGLHGKTAQLASDCLYSWSTSISLDNLAGKQGSPECDLCLMSKVFATSGGLLEGQGTIIGSTG